MWPTANQHLHDLIPYEPGKPIEDVARELGIPADSIIKLASNENPLGPSPLALQALRESLGQLHLYPDGGAYHLREAIAATHGLTRDHIIPGSGSNEIIELLFHAFTTRGHGTAIASEHAFIVYKLCARLFGSPFVEVPAREFQQDLPALLDAITSDTRLLFVVNPNNPTGLRLPDDELEAFIRQVPEQVIVVLDEAYYEYLDSPPPSLRWLREKPNLILLRTFSKIHGLAGLRLGYGIAHPDLVSTLQRCRQPFNTTAAAQTAALAALSDHEHIAHSREMNKQGLARAEALCRELSLPFLPSAGNFITVRTGDGKATFDTLLKQGIITRPIGGYGMPEWLRISIGTPEEMDRLSSSPFL